MQFYIKAFGEYIFALLKKWVLWIFFALDAIGFVIVYFLKQVDIPPIVYLSIAIIGVLIAGFLVYLDQTKKSLAITREVEQDREFLLRFMEILPSRGTMTYIRDYDFGGTFDVDWLTDLYHFVNECKNPEFEFINPNLEKIKKKLYMKSDEFLSLIGLETYPIKIPGRRLNQLPPESARYEEVRKKLNNLAQEIIDTYDELIRRARRI